MDVYETQKRYFEKAYKKGEHGWPVTGVSPPVIRFLKRFQSEQGTGCVLDIGCGEGRHTGFFAEAGYQSVGLDYQSLALARAARFFEGDRSNFHLVRGDVFHLPFSSESFDVLIDYGCLHHVRRRDTKAYLQSVVPLLKPGGYFLLCCFSEHFKHHPAERRTRDWVVHRGHYDRFFRRGDFAKIFGESFDILELEEDREALYAFYYVLLKKKG
ncbi:MAG: class I SAM-dependent methyltransferase [Nitrospiria bacterium]